MSGNKLPSMIPVDHDPFAEASEGVVRFAMTEAQREIWASVQMGAEASSAYNVCHIFRLRGMFSIEAMKTALQKVFERHQALRLVCDPDGETQHVTTSATIPVVTEDLSMMTSVARERETTRWLQREGDIPFDLEKGPLCRAVILREDRESHLIVFTAHHIVCDGWSVGILTQDLSELYAAAQMGKAASLPPAHSFQSYVAAQNRPAQLQQAAEAERYWKAQFAEPVAPLELPLDALRQPVKSYAAERQRRRIPDALYRDVCRIASQNNCSPYVVLFATLQVLIQRLSGQGDFVLGAVLASQAAEENASSMVGHATNVLPVRANVNSEA